jgi:hypothetical protein
MQNLLYSGYLPPKYAWHWHHSMKKIMSLEGFYSQARTRSTGTYAMIPFMMNKLVSLLVVPEKIGSD